MRTIRFYLAPIVLAIWLTVWTIGVRSDRLVGFFGALFAVAMVIMQRESLRRWKGRDDDH